MKNAWLLLTLFSIGCASSVRQPTPEELAKWERVEAVRVTKNTEATKGCRFIGNVVPTPVDYATRDRYRSLVGTRIRDREAQRQADAQADAKGALFDMKFKTDQVGGNLLFVVSDFPAATGEAYSCPTP